jgi:hypothetical protein
MTTKSLYFCSPSPLRGRAGWSAGRLPSHARRAASLEPPERGRSDSSSASLKFDWLISCRGERGGRRGGGVSCARPKWRCAWLSRAVARTFTRWLKAWCAALHMPQTKVLYGMQMFL